MCCFLDTVDIPTWKCIIIPVMNEVIEMILPGFMTAVLLLTIVVLGIVL